MNYYEIQDIGKITLPNQILASGIFAITALSFAQMDLYTYMVKVEKLINSSFIIFSCKVLTRNDRRDTRYLV